MITHQTPEDILKAATPAQKIIWNEIFLQFGKMTAITQNYYCGTFAGSEYATYSANKMYFALMLKFHSVGAAVATTGSAALYNRANVAMFNLGNNAAAYNTVGAAYGYVANFISDENVLFSRITIETYFRITFIGYRLNF